MLDGGDVMLLGKGARGTRKRQQRTDIMAIRFL